MKKEQYGMQISKAMGILILAVLCFIGCPDGNNEPTHIDFDSDATLKSLIISGNEIALGNPGVTVGTAGVKELNIAKADAQNGISVIAETNSVKAGFGYAVTSSLDSPLTEWVSSGNVPVNDGDFLVIRVSAEDNTVLYYVCKINVVVVVEGGEQDELAGKLLILTAYGAGPTGVIASHSFVELYNATDGEINLDGYSLYYADGTSSNSNGSSGGGIGPDKPWTRVDLSGNTMNGRTSLLVLGAPKAASGAVTGVTFADGDADITVPAMTLSNRAFKVAVLYNTGSMIIANPFDMDGNGTTAAGYVDLLGARNTDGIDQIQAFEGKPARCSASAAPRRISLTDTSNNTADFEEMRYGEISTELRELRMPRNLNADAWDPFAEPANPTVAGLSSPHAGSLLIFQAGASTDGAITRSFVELYNNTGSNINLNTYSLQYGTTGSNWSVIKLTGTIPSKGSYLVRGPLGTISSDSRLYLEDADQTIDDFRLSNNGFKVALMANQDTLTVANPFSMEGGTAKDYVDLLGATNGTHPDSYETAYFSTISKQAAARRSSLVDTDNNSTDFARIDYRTSGTTNDDVAKYRPRFSDDGTWDPFEPSDVPVSETILILQANTYGNTNGGRAAGLHKSAVELYNKSTADIDLTAGNYYLHIGSAAAWTYAIQLQGVIPAGCSYLITSSISGQVNGTPPALFPTPDQEFDFEIVNNPFKVALIRNQPVLSAANPFTESSLWTDYVDLFGVGTAAAEGTSFPSGDQSRPRVPRRTSLSDTNNNATDFSDVDYRGGIATSIDYADLYKYWPRNAELGPWDPITGLPKIDPAAP